MRQQIKTLAWAGAIALGVLAAACSDPAPVLAPRLADPFPHGRGADGSAS